MSAADRSMFRYISSLEEAQAHHIEQLSNLKMSLKERSRTAHEARPHAECVPARDVIDRGDRAENSIEVSQDSVCRKFHGNQCQYPISVL